MKLFLSSTAVALPFLSTKLPKKGKGARVLFSENASDNIPGDHFWVKNDRKVFKKMGCEVLEFDARNVSKSDFADLLGKADVVHFCGGSTMYLTYILQKTGLGALISKKVKAGRLIYSGTSAGSMAAAGNLKILTFDEDEKEWVKKMKNFAGLGLPSFLLIPHCNQKEFIEYAKSIVGYLPKHSIPLVCINDNQAVWVEDEKFEILSV